MNKKSFLVIGTIIIVITFTIIILKSYQIAKNRNNIEDLPIIKSDIEVIKIKQETRELENNANSFYETFDKTKEKNNIDGNKTINIVEIEKDEEMTPLGDNTILESRINRIIDHNSVKDNTVIDDEKNKENTDKNINTTISEKKIIENNNKFFRAQLVALKNKQQADIFVEKTRKRYENILKGLELFITEIDLNEKGVFYRIQVGNFNTKDEAIKFCEEYKKSPTGKDLTNCIVVKI